jgi:Asp-tRNA(Asn)/Glu-tRNA(Gln) amidotransferase A subunit family amidase
LEEKGSRISSRLEPSNRSPHPDTGACAAASLYCGVTGFRPSYGLLSMDGVLPLAKSLDTLGFFTHTPADMLLLCVSEVEPAMQTAFRIALSAFRNAGVSIQSVDIGMLATDFLYDS